MDHLVGVTCLLLATAFLSVSGAVDISYLRKQRPEWAFNASYSFVIPQCK